MEGSAIVYAAGSDESSVAGDMTKSGVETEKYIENGSLRIIPRESLFSMCNKNAGSINDFLGQKHLSTLSRQGRFGRILILITHDQWQGRHNAEDNCCCMFLDKECAGGKFAKPLDIVCCYNDNILADLPLRDIILILQFHQYKIQSGWKYCRMDRQKVVWMIKKGMTNSLGEETTQILLKTLKLIYKINEHSILSDPGHFEDVLKRILGASADIVLASIRNEIKRSMTYDEHLLVE